MLNQLSAGGDTIKLEPKAMAVLMYLAGRDAHVATREALLATVWSGAVVGDDSLTQVILKLRKALGDVRDKPEYIQTIPKVGYRLVAPVVRSERTVPLPSAPARAHTEHKSRVHWLAAASVTAALLAAVGAWWIAPDRASISRHTNTSSVDSLRCRQALQQLGL